MGVYNDVVPYRWTEVDRLAKVTHFPGALVTPYNIPPKALNYHASVKAGDLVHVPLGASVDPPVVARFFRQGYEWVKLPPEIDPRGKTMVELFLALFRHDKLRFAHFDPIVESALSAARHAEEIVTGIQAATEMDLAGAIFQSLDIAQSVLEVPMFTDLARLHFDYWGNTDLRAKVVGSAIQSVSPTAGPFHIDIPAPWFGTGGFVGAVRGLLSTLVPITIPVEKDGVPIARVLARKLSTGVPIAAVPRQIGGSAPEITLQIASIEPPRIELDGWETQTLKPFRMREWKLGKSKIRFRITIPSPAQQVRIEIMRGHTVYYQETKGTGAYLVPGIHLFGWDGRDQDGVYDSIALKSNDFSARLIVVDTAGRVSYASTDLGTGPGYVRWVDSKVDPRSKKIEVVTYAKFANPSDLEIGSIGLELPIPGGTSVDQVFGEGMAGAVDKAGSFGSLLGAAADYLPLPEVLDDVTEVIAGRPANPESLIPTVPGVPRVTRSGNKLNLTVTLPTTCDLDPETFARFKTLIKDGIRRVWSRTGRRGVHIDGVQYDVHTSAVERDVDANTTYLSGLQRFRGPQDMDRSFNLAFVEGLPICNIWDPSDRDSNRMSTGAHELGHTILRECYNLYVSMTHKGTSDIPQNRLPTAPNRDLIPKTQDLDVMLYMWGGWSDDDIDRTFGTEDDTRGLVTLGCVVFG